MSGAGESVKTPRTVSAADEPGVALKSRVARPVALLALAAAAWSLHRFVPFFSGTHMLSVIVPLVGLAGYFFGFRFGFIASLLGLAAHVALHDQFGEGGLVSLWQREPAVHASILLLGPALGRLRTTGRRLREEIRRRRLFEDELRSSTRQYRMIVERMSEGVVQCANDGTILYVNQQFCDLTGYSQEELIGTRASDKLVTDEYRDILNDRLSGRLEGGSDPYRVPVRTGAGVLAWFQINGAPIRGDDGRVTGGVGTFTDVTSVVRAQERLKVERSALLEAEARLRQLGDNIEEIFWITSVDRTQMLYVSPAYDQILGRPRAETYQNPQALYEYVHHDDREMLERALGNPPTQSYELEYRIVRPDGQVRWLHSRAFPVRDADDQIYRIAGVTSDITERRRYEKFHEARGAVLEALASGDPFDDVLSRLTLSTVDILAVSACAVLIGDANGAQYEVAASAGLPGDFVDALCASDTCGAQAIREGKRTIGAGGAAGGKPVGTEKSPFRACWSEPIRASSGRIIGALVVYSTCPRTPDDHELDITRVAANLAGIAFERKRTSEALEEGKQRLRRFVEHSPVAIAMFDSDMCYLTASSRWLADHDLPAAGWVGRSHYDMADVPERWKAIYRRCMEGAIEKRNEDMVARPDGRIDWMRREVHPWRRLDGTVGGVIVWTEVITEQKQAKERLLRSEAQLRFLIEHLPDWLTELDVAGNILFASRRFPHLDDREVVGTSMFDYLPAAQRASLRRALDDAARTRAACDFDAEFAAEGETTWWSHRVVPIIENDIIVKFLLISTDVSAKELAQGALRDSEDRYRRFFEDNISGSFIEAPDGSFLAVNPAFAAMCGYETVEDAMQANSRELFLSDTEHSALMADLHRTPTLSNIEIEMRRRDGRHIHVVANVAAEFLEDGRLSQISGHVSDHTARKQLEGQLHQAQKMEAIGRLAGGIAHDFNNMLTSISGYNELLMGKLDSADPLYRYTQEILRASDRAAELTRSLLEFSRKQVLQPKVIDVNHIVQGMKKMLEHTIGEDIHLVVETDPNLGRIEADPGLIENAILNLALNSRDAMPDGGVLTISTREITIDGTDDDTPGLEPGTYSEIMVRDTGIGMDNETRERIFEPFFTTKDPGQGTGLGLATVYGAVRQSGGHIRVSSEPGRGATFYVYFDVIEDRVPVPAGERERFLGPSHGSETVLIAEDELAVQRLMQTVLEGKGYRVLVAGDGQEAMSVCDAHGAAIDLLITDLVMPRMNGRELADQIRTRHPSIRVLYISGYIGKASVRVAELGQGASFLSKPFSPQSLARKVRLLLDTNRGRASSTYRKITSPQRQRADTPHAS